MYQHNFNWHERTDNGGGINYYPVYQLGTTSGAGIDMSGYIPAGFTGSKTNYGRDYAAMLGIVSISQIAYTRSGTNLALNPPLTPASDKVTDPLLQLLWQRHLARDTQVHSDLRTGLDIGDASHRGIGKASYLRSLGQQSHQHRTILECSLGGCTARPGVQPASRLHSGRQHGPSIQISLQSVLWRVESTHFRSLGHLRRRQDRASWRLRPYIWTAQRRQPSTGSLAGNRPHPARTVFQRDVERNVRHLVSELSQRVPDRHRWAGGANTSGSSNSAAAALSRCERGRSGSRISARPKLPSQPRGHLHSYVCTPTQQPFELGGWLHRPDHPQRIPGGQPQCGALHDDQGRPDLCQGLCRHRNRILR